MKKATKIGLLTAVFFILTGMIVFCAAAFSVHWDFKKFNTQKYETKLYDISEDFRHIAIKNDIVDIVFLPSEDETCKVICHEQENFRYSATVRNETLLIEVTDERKWYDHIGINFGEEPKLTVYLPKEEWASLSIQGNTCDLEIPQNFKFQNADLVLSTGDIHFYASVSENIKVKTGSGDITLENLKCTEEIRISVSTGDIKLKNIACKTLVSTGNTSDIVLKNVIASEKFSITTSTGDVKFDGCDAAEISVATGTGDVSGTLLSEKKFMPKTSTGDIEVPKTENGGLCEITTSTGDIEIMIKNR